LPHVTLLEHKILAWFWFLRKLVHPIVSVRNSIYYISQRAFVYNATNPAVL